MHELTNMTTLVNLVVFNAVMFVLIIFIPDSYFIWSPLIYLSGIVLIAFIDYTRHNQSKRSLKKGKYE